MKDENEISSEKNRIALNVEKYYTHLYSFTIPGPDNRNKERKTTNVESETPPKITNEEVRSEKCQETNQKWKSSW